MLNKKGQMEISIALLVLATLVLVTFALYTFTIKKSAIEESVYVGRFVENIYAREDIINFYINEILEKSVEDFNKSEDTIDKVVNNFRAELEKYKKDGKYFVEGMEQAESQADNLVLEEDKVTAEFTFKLNSTDELDKETLFLASYTYTKKFEKQV